MAALLFGAYYYFSNIKKVEPGHYFQPDNDWGVTSECEDSLDCLNEEIKECSKAKGTTTLGDLGTIELEVLGKQGSSCIVFGKMLEIKEIPVDTKMISEALIKDLFKDLSIECLIPREAYRAGIDGIGIYINEKLTEVCRGPLFDIADKFNIDLDNI